MRRAVHISRASYLIHYNISLFGVGSGLVPLEPWAIRAAPMPSRPAVGLVERLVDIETNQQRKNIKYIAQIAQPTFRTC